LIPETLHFTLSVGQGNSKSSSNFPSAPQWTICFPLQSCSAAEKLWCLIFTPYILILVP